VVVLATGDPLWFGIGTILIRVFGAAAVDVRPNVSGLQIAAARMNWQLESLEILSVHGRPAETVLPFLYPRARLLVIGEGANSGCALASLLCDAGYGEAMITALSNLGGADETRIDAMAREWRGTIPAFSILAIACPDTPACRSFLDDAKIENDGKLTKYDLRANALAKLAPFPGAVMWDLGAGSGAVAIEFLRAAPRACAYAVDRDPHQIEMARRNARRFGVSGLNHVQADLPSGLDDLPPPDAVFLGGGISPELIAAARTAIRIGGNLVAHAVTLESEACLLSAWREYGGDMTRLAVQKADPVGGFHGWRPLMPVTQWHFVKAESGQP
jgi:precorrin-6Y C5,15-methyltransferase (decarboxylating)